jgi:hypothetical protein
MRKRTASLVTLESQRAGLSEQRDMLEDGVFQNKAKAIAQGWTWISFVIQSP